MNREHIEELWSKFLSNAELSPEEEHNLLEVLRSDPALRHELLKEARIDGWMSVWGSNSRDSEAPLRRFLKHLGAESDATSFIKKVETRIEENALQGRVGLSEGSAGTTGTSGLQRRSTRRTARRQSTDQSSSWAVLAVAAAVVAAVTLFVVLSPSGSEPAASQRAKDARARASQEAEARRQSERDRLERERALADSEARSQEAEAQTKRLEAEAQLREIKEKRKVLTQAKPEAQEDPQAKAQRERDLEALKRDQEQIEQELREAAQLAKKTAPPTSAKPPQAENPQSPLAAPGPQPQGGTQAALAKVEEISGEAFVATKDGKSPVSAGANLLPGQGLETGGGPSRIVLRFPDKTRVDLGPDSVLAEVKTDSGKRLAVMQGTIRAVVAKQPKGEPMILTTPHGQATVVGTTLRLYVDPDPKKGTKLEVEEGKVELKNLAGKTVMVESGHYAVAAVGVELVARVLPPRPRPAAFVYRNPKTPWGAILQTVPLVPDRTYTLSVWIQASAPFPSGSIGVRTDTGAILAQQPFGTTSYSYVRTVLNFKAGLNPTAVIFAGFANDADADACFHVDDWSLIEKGGDGANLVQDPDYEGQNQATLASGFASLAGPWYTEGPSGRVGNIGFDLVGRIPAKGSPQGERK
jgi:hypothetical protein